MSFLELRFERKMALLAFGRAPSASQKALSKSRRTFSGKIVSMNDTKTPELAKSARKTGNICDRPWHLSKRG